MVAPSGPQAGVLARAVIFAGDRSPTIVYLSTLTTEARQRLDRLMAPDAAVEGGTLVRRPDDGEWVPANSPAGQTIMARTAELAAGRTWRVALPP